MDWNKDGKKDLITGERNGTIRIYLNTNTDADPQFNGYTFLLVNGSTYDVGLNSHPFVVDWNNDGRFDLLVGEDAGKVHLLINKSLGLLPDFNTPVWIKKGASNLTTGNEASPAAVDWNRDGKKDLLVGDYYGRVIYYENEGTDAAPVFNTQKFLTAGGSTIDVQYYARIDVADWNNDGVMDLLSGNRNYSASPTGGVWFFKANGPLSADVNCFSEASGGIVNMTLNAGPANGGRNYLIFGSVTGTEPGTPLPGGMVVLPINWDFFTSLVISLANTPVFANFMGTLNNAGQAKATLNTYGPVPGTAGLILTFAYPLNGPWNYVSNGLNVEITP